MTASNVDVDAGKLTQSYVVGGIVTNTTLPEKHASTMDLVVTLLGILLGM